MYLQKIQIRNFRCFDNFEAKIDKKITLIEGENGCGKTSILEALYYLCYLRSFKTRITKELISYNKDNFFLKIELSDNIINREIQAGFSQAKRSIKVDKKNIKSYKELIDQYKIIAVTEDDLSLIKSSPEKRRSFLDHYILLLNPELMTILKDYKHIVDSRNALLKRDKLDLDSYNIWTQQLWDKGQKIRIERINALDKLKNRVVKLYQDNFEQNILIDFVYNFKNGNLEDKNFEEFQSRYARILNQEKLFRKGLFGAHFDDFDILWNRNLAKNFSSRGQQKLLVILMKIAQIQESLESSSDGHTTIFLLDDFMTDFDEEKLNILISIINSLNIQIIFTCPLKNSPIKEQLKMLGAEIVSI
ncbi:hypothetical protein A3F66_00530 [candidate division TM6 bacterium RIFCSPHIGHO2_12_FULL_32_22]|nr:MAG: hypothetical protein A3F66_00530 [candidate division TM6 bacterium RIFCSPHIGHO2_12_FULL_32_22]